MNPLIRARRKAGTAKRTVERALRDRTIGTEYRAWLADARSAVPGTTSFTTTVSVIVPVYNPPVAFLRECLDSVVNQQARNWQLVIVNDGSTNEEIRSYLSEFADAHSADDRIVVLHKENGGISSALNAALERSSGEYVGMLDHDDVLDPRCIDAFARAVEDNQFPEAVYSDEDKIDVRGRHFELYCKPDFSPELLLTQMYLCHFTIYRRDLVINVGGLRSEVDGAQDFDLALRLLPALHNVVHLARPLYHWRAWSESTALQIEAKPWAQEAAARVQQHYMDRTFGGGKVGPSAVPGLNEVHPQIQGDPLVSVIITGADAGVRFDDALQSLVQLESRARFEAASGRATAIGDYLLFLDAGMTAAEADPITRLLEIGQIDGVGVVGGLLTDSQDRLAHAGIVLTPAGPVNCWKGRSAREPGYFGSTLTPRNYLAVSAAAMLVSTSVFDALGGFDSTLEPALAEVDFCLRAALAGHRVAWTPYARFLQHDDDPDLPLLTQRWSAAVAVDPFYSPALSQSRRHLYEVL